MLLACLYTKQNFLDVTKVKLDDCSDKSGDVVGNLYFKLKMAPIITRIIVTKQSAWFCSIK